jgi:hypothetical protein
MTANDTERRLKCSALAGAALRGAGSFARLFAGSVMPMWAYFIVIFTSECRASSLAPEATFRSGAIP